MEEVTLLFRHLPLELSMEERKDLLHYLGAKRVQVMEGKGRMKNTAFAVFQSKEEAQKIVKEIHEAEFLGSKLKVEFAHRNESRVASVVDKEGLENKRDPDQETSKKDGDVKEEPAANELIFDETFQTWGLKHQRRPDLCYLYPPPTPSTLTNIMHALAAVPKFYVQVLHLMNKMDLPAPFGTVTSAPPVYQDVRGYVVTDDAPQQEMDISSDTESELESDEDHKKLRPNEQDQVKRLLKKKASHQRKRPRLTELIDTDLPQLDTSAAETPALPLTEVFEQADHVATARKIELKISANKLLSTHVPLEASTLRSSLNSNMAAGDSNTKIAETQNPTATVRELAPHNLQANIHFSASNSATLPHHPAYTSVGPEQQQFQPITQHQQHPPKLAGAVQAVSSLSSEHINPYDVPLPPPQEQQRRLHPTVQGGQDEWQETVSDFASSSQIEETPKPNEKPTSTAGFGILEPQQRIREESSSEEETQEKEWSRSEFISSSELKKNRLSHSEMKDYSVFRRYNEGDPSCRLYIKNLGKQVTEEDIHWIFGRYVDWEDPTEKLRFDIRLMKEGRMKGQAFVALPSEQAASSAVKDTNGFLLKDKPMVVQFARSAKAQEDNSFSKPK